MNTDGTTAVADRACKDRARCGFSLIEVCLAVLVVGLGLLSIVSLFPSGLRSAEDAVADTRCGLFTECVMSQLRANALDVKDRSVWDDEDLFREKVMQGVLEDVRDPDDGHTKTNEFPDGSNMKLQFRLTVGFTTNPPCRSATLAVFDGEFGTFYTQSVAYTEFWYPGM